MFTKEVTVCVAVTPGLPTANEVRCCKGMEIVSWSNGNTLEAILNLSEIHKGILMRENLLERIPINTVPFAILTHWL